MNKVNIKNTVHTPHWHGYMDPILYVDLVGPLPRNDRGKAYILTMQDGFSRFTIAIPIPTKEAAVVGNAVLNGWITKHVCPNNIHSDQGT